MFALFKRARDGESDNTGSPLGCLFGCLWLYGTVLCMAVALGIYHAIAWLACEL